MKTIKQLLSELPNKSLIFAFGRFNPPTVGHELLISKVEALSKKTSIPYRIYTTATQDKKSNPLSQKDKIKYMEKSFRNAHIYAAKGNIIQLLQSFEKEGIKEIHLVVGSDRTKEFESLLNKYNGRDYKFSKIEIHSAGERDPDSDDADGMSASKMRSAATKGDYKSFEKGVTKKLTDVDTKKMYNDVRKGLGLKTESFEINISNNQNELREKYFRGEVFKIGSTVKDDKGVYEVMDRGTNYITVINENGELSKKWLDSVKEVITDMNYKTEAKDKHQISYKGFTTSNFEIVPELKPIIESVISAETDSVAVINALKSIDESLKFYKQNKDIFQVPLIKGVDALKNIDYAVSGMVSDLILKLPRDTFKETSITEASDNPFNFTSADKIKIARIIAGALGIDNPEKMSSPEQLINLGLRKLRTKRITPELSDVVNQMLKTADMLDVKYDKKLLPQAMQEATGDKQERITKLKDRVSALLDKLGKINPADADAKTQMAIIKSDIATAKLRLQGLQSKKEAVDILGPLGSIDVQNDLITPATMPSFMKFGEEVEMLKETNRYIVKTIVRDPAPKADGEKRENKELSRSVFALTPADAMEKVKKVLKTTGYQVISQSIVKTEKVSEEELKESGAGLWANIHARRKKGLRPKRPGEEGYPKTLDIESKETEKELKEKDKDDPCWVGYKQVGMKKKDGKEVPNCVPESTKLESVLNLIRRIKEQKKTMLVARPNNLRKPGQERVIRIPVDKWADYRKKGFIQAEEKENENS
ncbi:hypothetical protein EBU71_02775 [bacterium]|nr:hypothetical protein [Candidatus Elulimicrobium humile]